MATVTELQAAREAAIARGDKALGREIFHQLLNMGLRPEDIGTRAAAVEALGVEAQFTIESVASAIEAAVPQGASAMKGRRRPTSSI